ncbi:MAG: hypothetical protein HQM09_15930 [Candidatus Riflebacteria bacterium]|nr:hypothetical protein [Candidatus Riflebacteria bacterium]
MIIMTAGMTDLHAQTVTRWLHLPIERSGGLEHESAADDSRCSVFRYTFEGHSNTLSRWMEQLDSERKTEKSHDVDEEELRQEDASSFTDIFRLDERLREKATEAQSNQMASGSLFQDNITITSSAAKDIQAPAAAISSGTAASASMKLR